MQFRCADCDIIRPSFEGVRGDDGLMRCKNKRACFPESDKPIVEDES